ncbi:glycine cleavage system protein GcvH [Demequina zhanjiangensis]|uniref:Glycine cleavage system H protein n=1 Tax=Demequina zhanjiangensis TaxID=3051659 RepID=A0ABT8FZK0_9MICO|nr:glycine cleavage system protein GcvH [Demequina sp. SYSU T00b26]MDN4472321.1 glycine cleavage system protein GcvH [Demequina sp. SYSU T00b26]
MAHVPEELLYSEEHEWVSGELAEDSVVTVGITEHAAEALGDIVYVELPAVGDSVSSGEVCGELESTKAVSEMYSPVTGEVVAVNEELSDAPETIGEDAYGEGWIFRVRLAEEPSGLLDSEAYAKITE